MSGVVTFLVTLAIIGGILGALPWLASRVRRRGVGSAVFGPIEEIWGYPAAHRFRFEIEAQQERRAPAPAPGDGA